MQDNCHLNRDLASYYFRVNDDKGVLAFGGDASLDEWPGDTTPQQFLLEIHHHYHEILQNFAYQAELA